MERPLWNRIQEIYHLTLPIPRSERSAFLAGACNSDQVLVREVKSLLRADDAADGFLESPIFELGLQVISSSNRNDGRIRFAELDDGLVGTTIDGRYLVEKEIGHGGIGKVYLARDVTLHNRRVVIKVLLQASLSDPYLMTKFRQEVEALSRIDHPNVVGVLGAGELPDGKPYIAMQYVDGVTLRSKIPTEGMDLERAALILRQIGTALDYVHEQGIFHRDLKPENILLQFLTGGTEWVKVVDFGIAKVKDSVVAPSTANKVPVGTVLYMSPEQLRGGERITAASDIYSMAVIAYETITGRRPFNPSSAPQLLEMHREGVRLNPIDLRPSLSTEARAILLRALSFDPAARYQNAAEFGDQLARALTEQAKRVSTPPKFSADAETIKSEGVAHAPNTVMRRYLIGGLLMLAVSTAIGIYLKGNSQPPDKEGAAKPAPTPEERSFSYWLTVRKMHGGKPDKDEFESAGKEPFGTGDKFLLHVTSAEPGFVYLFNEGPPSRSGTSFTIVYPTPLTNEGSATLGANQEAHTNWNTFAGETGSENFWIVWSLSPVKELEEAKQAAFKHPQGGLTGDIMEATKRFLMRKKDEVKTYYKTDNEHHQTNVRGNGELLVRMVEFQHR